MGKEQRLPVLKPSRGGAFRRRGPVPNQQQGRVELDWYPKIHAMKSLGVAGGDAVVAKHAAFLTAAHVAFMDVDRIYFELERFKAERGWCNLNLTRERIRELLGNTSWYTLLIPAEEMAFTSFAQVRVWEEIALALLKQYTQH
jgi:hypothetical protein